MKEPTAPEYRKQILALFRFQADTFGQLADLLRHMERGLELGHPDFVRPAITKAARHIDELAATARQAAAKLSGLHAAMSACDAVAEQTGDQDVH